jgi:hypothetical protein
MLSISNRISNCLYFQIIFGVIVKYGVILESGELLNKKYYFRLNNFAISNYCSDSFVLQVETFITP